MHYGQLHAPGSRATTFTACGRRLRPVRGPEFSTDRALVQCRACVRWLRRNPGLSAPIYRGTGRRP